MLLVTGSLHADVENTNEVQLLKLANEHFHQDISRTEGELFRAAANGGDLVPAAGSSAFDDPTNAANWPATRSIRADRLAWLCGEPAASALVGYRGIRMAGLRIDGPLNLEWAHIAFPFIAGKCAFSGEISLSYCHLRAIGLAGSHVKKISARHLEVDDDVILGNGFSSEGGVDLQSSTIGGHLICDGGHFFNPNGRALNADGATIRGSVYLRRGFEALGEVNLVYADIAETLECDGGRFVNANTAAHALDLHGAKVGGSISFSDGFHAAGEVRLFGARIGKDLYCDKGSFANTNGSGIALNANSARVEGTVSLSDHFRAEGMVDLTASTIGGFLTCEGGHFINPVGYALGAPAARIGGDVFLRNDFRSEGEVNFERAIIGGDLFSVQSYFINTNTNGFALKAYGARIDGTVVLGDHFQSKGSVDLHDSTIGGTLRCSSGNFSFPSGLALNANGVTIHGGVFLDELHADGEVNFAWTTIGRSLQCNGGQFVSTNSRSIALDLDGVRIEGSVMLNSNFYAEGETRLLGANIGRDLECVGGRFIDINSSGIALNARSAKIKGNVFLRNQFYAQGQVDLTDADIGELLDCGGGDFVNAVSPALQAESLHVKDVFLINGFHSQGAVFFDNAVISGDLNCRGGQFEFGDPGGPALDVNGAKIGGGLLLDKSFNLNGPLDLRFARVETVLDADESWPKTNNLLLDGFVYERFGPFSPVDADSRIRWLHRQSQDHFFPQPYEQLAKVLRNMGREIDADEVMIEKNKDYARHLHNYAVLWYGYIGQVNGYGYRPGRAFIISVSVILFGCLVFLSGFALGNVIPKKEAIELRRGQRVRKRSLRWFSRPAFRKDSACSSFSVDNIADWSALLNRLRRQSDPVSAFVWQNFSEQDQFLLMNHEPSMARSSQAQDVVVQVLNAVVGQPCIYEGERFKGVSLRPETIDLMRLGSNVAQLNRYLLEDAYPLELSGNKNFLTKHLGALFAKNLGFNAPRHPTLHLRKVSLIMGALSYSIETFVPLVEIGMEKRWTVQGGWYRSYFHFHRLLGWFLTTLWIGALTGLVKT